MADVSDLVARLRDWRSLHLTRLGGLFDEAADEIARLRLTDEEREAIETACVSLERDDRFYENESALLRANLERLLERLK